MQLSWLEQQLINDYQGDFPLCNEPFKALAAHYNVEEIEVLNAVKKLADNGILSRLGPVFDHKKAGASTLVAIAVPEKQLDKIAGIVNQFTQVNHNYAREHEYNLWFVVTDQNEYTLNKTLANIEEKIGIPLLLLPMEDSYHIDLSFKIDFDSQGTEKKQQTDKEKII